MVSTTLTTKYLSQISSIKPDLIKLVFAKDMENILKPSSQINEIDCHGNTPLLLATKLSCVDPSYIEIIKVLLEKDANP